MYFSAKTQQFFERPDVYGLMATYRVTGGQWDALKSGCKWMLDNGAFTKNYVFKKWVWFLTRMIPYRINCIGVVVPDEPYNAFATIRKFHQFRAVPEALGYKIAFTSQDGMTVDMVPWSLFDTLFVGGSDFHKRGYEAQLIGQEARRRGKWVHIGRVSSGSAIIKHWLWADSFDGTTFCFDGGTNPVEKKMRTITPVVANLRKYNFQWRLL
jgi:hypothetical protein